MMTDLLGGQVDMAFDTIATAEAHIDSGVLRAIGATMAKRPPSAPEIPSDEQGLKDCVGGTWFGFLGPAQTLPPPSHGCSPTWSRSSKAGSPTSSRAADSILRGSDRLNSRR